MIYLEKAMAQDVKTKDEIICDWRARGFSCDLWEDPPGRRWENYRHDTDEVIYVLEGVFELEVSGEKRTLKPGEEAFIPAQSNHSVRNIGGTWTRWLYGYRFGK